MKLFLRRLLRKRANSLSLTTQSQEENQKGHCTCLRFACCTKIRIPSLTKQQWLTLFVVAGIHLSSSMSGSLHAPFFPQEAERKGATATEYGLVFAIFQFVMFIASPLFGKYTDKMGAKKTINMFIFVVAFSCITFGLLHYIEDRVTFIGLCFLVRAVQACGASAVSTASLAVIADVFPDSVTTTISTLEIFFGLGFFVGPTFGGYLFQVGGYICPFLVMGSFLLLIGAVIFFALPDSVRDKTNSKPPVKIFSVLKIPAVTLDALSLTTSSMGAGYYAAILEPHVRLFQLSPVATGFLFVISGGTYALVSPIAGRLCDTGFRPKRLIIFGSCCIIVGFLLVGPIPFVPVETTLWMICVGLFIHGVGYAFVLSPAYTDVLRTAVAHGFPEDMTTYGLVSGIWISSLGLGAFVGPAAAGILYDLVGFRLGTLFVISLVGAVAIAMVVFVCTEIDSKKPSSGDEDVQCDANLTAQNSQNIANSVRTLADGDVKHDNEQHYKTSNVIANCVLSLNTSDVKDETIMTARISPSSAVIITETTAVDKEI